MGKTRNSGRPASLASPSKVPKTENQLDVRRGTTAALPVNSTDVDQQWKLVVCHAPGRMSFSDAQSFFDDSIDVKEISRGVIYGKRTAVEVSFYSEADMNRALELFNNTGDVDRGPYIWKSSRVTLKRPADALDEMNCTEYFWKHLPLHLMDEVLVHLAPVYWGRRSTRVGRVWKASLERAQRSCLGMYIIPGDGSSPRSPNPSFSSVPRPFAGDITHIALFGPTCYLPSWTKALGANQQIRKMTVVNEMFTLVTSDMDFGRTRIKPSSRHRPFYELWKHLDVFNCIDSFVAFTFNLVEDEVTDEFGWTLTVFVPRLVLQVPNLSEPAEERRESFIHQVMAGTEAQDLWWSYPPEQTEWLRKSLELLDEEQREEVEFFLSCKDRLDYSVPQIKATHSSKKIVFEGYVLDKKDYAVVGHYIQLQDDPRIPPPPCKWANTHLKTSSSDYDRDVVGYQTALREMRGRVKRFLV